MSEPRCRRCDVVLTDDNWYPNRRRRQDKLCKACLGQIETERRHKTPVRQMLYAAKSRAKAKGLEFSLKPEDIVIPERCPVLWHTLKHSYGSYGSGDWSPTIDRIDSTKGYTRDNVTVISARANRLKGDATVEELECIVSYYRHITKRKA